MSIKLSAGFINTIYDGNHTFQQFTVQALQVKWTNKPQLPHEYRLIISDGIFYTQSWLATELNNFVLSAVIGKNSVILVKGYDVRKNNAKGSITITLHDIEVLQGSVSERIGKPKRLRYVDEGMENVNDSEDAYNLFWSLTTPSADNYEGKSDSDIDELSEHGSRDLLTPASMTYATCTTTKASEHNDDITEGHDNVSMTGGENEDASFADIAVGDFINLQALKAKLEEYAEVGHFKINFETDAAAKYKGKTRILCRCSSAGLSRTMRNNNRCKNISDNDEEDIFQKQFSLSRNRKSLKTACPWRIIAWADTKPLCPDTVLSVTKINAVHNCNPSEELRAEALLRTTASNKIPSHVLEQMHSLVRYGVDTKRLRMFIINENLNLPTNAQSIVNLKLLILRAGAKEQLGNRTVESLRTQVTSIWKKDEITTVFSELLRLEKPDGPRVRNALEYTRSQIPGFDYRVRVGPDGELLSCLWQTGRMRARLRMYGDLLYLDAKAKANVEEWPIYFPTVLDCEGKARRVGVAVSYVEDGPTTQFILQQLRMLCPEW